MVRTLITLLGLSMLALLFSCKQESAKIVRPAAEGPPAHYSGTSSCVSCHQVQASEWSQSHHALAMQKANDSTVLADFNNIRFNGSVSSSRFFKEEGEFFVETEGVGGGRDVFKVIYTFGVEPLQQYLVDIGDGKIQALRTAWDADKNEWYDLYSEDEIIPQDWLHWTRGGLNWNTMCAECHTTDLNKNYDQNADTYATTFEEINVACEACHGAGEKHIEWANDPHRDSLSYILLTSNTESMDQVRSCAPCHSRKSNLTEKLTFTGDFQDSYIPDILRDGLYHSDGQILDEVYVYGSFLQSKMYHEGVKCTDCHNPHSLELKAPGNQLCLQCHEETYDSQSHTFHQEGTEAASCIECHMTGETYMGIDFRRDHSFRVPRPDQSELYGTPNACNSCHTDKTASWAAENIIKWYGEDRNPHFSDVLAPGRMRIPETVPYLAGLLADNTAPDIARATAAYYLSDIPSNESYGALVNALSDSSSLVRHYALSGLATLPAEQRAQIVAPYLNDPIKGVRIEAAELLSDLSKEQIPLEFQTSFNKTLFEYEESLNDRSDFPMGQFMLGQHYYKRNEIEKALLHFERALSMDTLLHLARENIARIYNQQGQNELAIETLLTTIFYDETNSTAYYSLGLIYAEQSNLEKSIEYLEKTTLYDPYNERAFYNLGLAYQHTENNSLAEETYLEGLDTISESIILRQALAILYIQLGDKGKATPFVEYLAERFPQQEQVIQLQRALQNL